MARVSSKNADIYFNAVKVGGLIDYTDLGVDFPIIDASDHDGAAQGMGIAKLGTFTVNAHYLDADTTQQTLLATVGDETGHVLSVRPFGTGTGKSKCDASAFLASWKQGAPKDGMQTLVLTFGWIAQPVWGTQP